MGTVGTDAGVLAHEHHHACLRGDAQRLLKGLGQPGAVKGHVRAFAVGELLQARFDILFARVDGDGAQLAHDQNKQRNSARMRAI